MVNEKNVQEINKIKITGDEIFEKLLNTERDIYRRFEGTIKISSKMSCWKLLKAHDERIPILQVLFLRQTEIEKFNGGIKNPPACRGFKSDAIYLRKEQGRRALVSP